MTRIVCLLTRSSFPIRTEHGLTFESLSAESQDHIVWSLMCPAMMTPAEPDKPKLSGRAPGNSLVGSADFPANWTPSWLRMIPFCGVFLEILAHAMYYNIKLEDCADFIAADLKMGFGSEYVGHRVSVANAPKSKSA